MADQQIAIRVTVSGAEAAQRVLAGIAKEGGQLGTVTVSGGKEAEAALASFGASAQKASAFMSQAGLNTGALGQAMSALTSPLALAAAGVATLGLAIHSATQSMVANFEEVRKLQAVSGLSADAADNLADTFQLLGFKSEVLTTALVKMAQEVDSGGKGLAKLGVTIEDLEGKVEGDTFLMLRDRIANLGTAGERSAAGMALFGRGFRELAPLFAMSSEELAKFQTRAAKFSEWSEEAAELTHKFITSGNALTLMFDGIAQEIGAALLPGLTAFNEGLADWIDAGRDVLRVPISQAWAVLSTVAVGLWGALKPIAEVLWELAKVILPPVAALLGGVLVAGLVAVQAALIPVTGSFVFLSEILKGNFTTAATTAGKVMAAQVANIDETLAKSKVLGNTLAALGRGEVATTEAVDAAKEKSFQKNDQLEQLKLQRAQASMQIQQANADAAMALEEALVKQRVALNQSPETDLVAVQQRALDAKAAALKQSYAMELSLAEQNKDLTGKAVADVQAKYIKSFGQIAAARVDLSTKMTQLVQKEAADIGTVVAQQDALQAASVAARLDIQQKAASDLVGIWGGEEAAYNQRLADEFDAAVESAGKRTENERDAAAAQAALWAVYQAKVQKGTEDRLNAERIMLSEWQDTVSDLATDGASAINREYEKQLNIIRASVDLRKSTAAEGAAAELKVAEEAVDKLIAADRRRVDKAREANADILTNFLSIENQMLVEHAKHIDAIAAKRQELVAAAITVNADILSDVEKAGRLEIEIRAGTVNKIIAENEKLLNNLKTLNSGPGRLSAIALETWAEQQKAAGDYFGFLGTQFKLVAGQAGTVYDDMVRAAQGTARAMHSGFSDLFFDLFTGKVHDLADVFKSFGLSMARVLSDFLASQAVKGLLNFFGDLISGLGGGASGGIGGWLAAALKGVTGSSGGSSGSGIISAAASGVAKAWEWFSGSSRAFASGMDGMMDIVDTASSSFGDLIPVLGSVIALGTSIYGLINGIQSGSGFGIATSAIGTLASTYSLAAWAFGATPLSVLVAQGFAAIAPELAASIGTAISSFAPTLAAALGSGGTAAGAGAAGAAAAGSYLPGIGMLIAFGGVGGLMGMGEDAAASQRAFKDLSGRLGSAVRAVGAVTDLFDDMGTAIKDLPTLFSRLSYGLGVEGHGGGLPGLDWARQFGETQGSGPNDLIAATPAMRAQVGAIWVAAMDAAHRAGFDTSEAMRSPNRVNREDRDVVEGRPIWLDNAFKLAHVWGIALEDAESLIGYINQNPQDSGRDHPIYQSVDPALRNMTEQDVNDLFDREALTTRISNAIIDIGQQLGLSLDTLLGQGLISQAQDIGTHYNLSLGGPGASSADIAALQAQLEAAGFTPGNYGAALEDFLTSIDQNIVNNPLWPQYRAALEAAANADSIQTPRGSRSWDPFYAPGVDPYPISRALSPTAFYTGAKALIDSLNAQILHQARDVRPLETNEDKIKAIDAVIQQMTAQATAWSNMVQRYARLPVEMASLTGTMEEQTAAAIEAFAVQRQVLVDNIATLRTAADEASATGNIVAIDAAEGALYDAVVARYKYEMDAIAAIEASLAKLLTARGAAQDTLTGVAVTELAGGDATAFNAILAALADMAMVAPTVAERLWAVNQGLSAILAGLPSLVEALTNGGEIFTALQPGAGASFDGGQLVPDAIVEALYAQVAPFFASLADLISEAVDARDLAGELSLLQQQEALIKSVSAAAIGAVHDWATAAVDAVTQLAADQVTAINAAYDAEVRRVNELADYNIDNLTTQLELLRRWQDVLATTSDYIDSLAMGLLSPDAATASTRSALDAANVAYTALPTPEGLTALQTAAQAYLAALTMSTNAAIDLLNAWQSAVDTVTSYVDGLVMGEHSSLSDAGKLARVQGRYTEAQEAYDAAATPAALLALQAAADAYYTEGLKQIQSTADAKVAAEETARDAALKAIGAEQDAKMTALKDDQAAQMTALKASQDARMTALRAEQSAAQDALDLAQQWVSSIESAKGFAQDLRLGEGSPLDADAKLALVRSNYDAALAAAQSSPAALGDLQSAAQDLLKVGGNTPELVAQLIADMDAAIAAAGPKGLDAVGIAQATLDAVTAQITAQEIMNADAITALQDASEAEVAALEQANADQLDAIRAASEATVAAIRAQADLDAQALTDAIVKALRGAVDQAPVDIPARIAALEAELVAQTQAIIDLLTAAQALAPPDVAGQIAADEAMVAYWDAWRKDNLEAAAKNRTRDLALVEDWRVAQIAAIRETEQATINGINAGTATALRDNADRQLELIGLLEGVQRDQLNALTGNMAPELYKIDLARRSNLILGEIRDRLSEALGLPLVPGEAPLPPVMPPAPPVTPSPLEPIVRIPINQRPFVGAQSASREGDQMITVVIPEIRVPVSVDGKTLTEVVIKNFTALTRAGVSPIPAGAVGRPVKR